MKDSKAVTPAEKAREKNLARVVARDASAIERRLYHVPTLSNYPELRKEIAKTVASYVQQQRGKVVGARF